LRAGAGPDFGSAYTTASVSGAPVKSRMSMSIVAALDAPADTSKARQSEVFFGKAGLFPSSGPKKEYNKGIACQ
jgi:hypothetical protein